MYHHSAACKSLPAFIIIAASILVGIYIRLDQFLDQTLIDDEWHAVHQLLYSTPEKFATSFGHADYSIPLTLLYWLESRLFGLSELLMRWPMLLFGMATLIVFPVVVYRQLSQQEASLFAFLLALSPLLDLYSRTARPYAITLFLVYLSVWAFYKFYQQSTPELPAKRFQYAAIYCLSASFAVWLHLIVVFFVVSPFVVEGIELFLKPRAERKRDFVALLRIGLPTLLLSSAFLLPPMLSSLSALTVKTGAHLPSLDTLAGAVYLWMGSRSGFIVALCCLLALVGLPRLLKQSSITLNILVGAALTLALIFLSQPAWVNHPLTLGRYLLPLLPLLLLSVASGLYVMLEILGKLSAYPVACLALMIGFVVYSPLDHFMHRPNRNTLHPIYSFEFRDEKNITLHYHRAKQYSDFWRQFENAQPESITIAVAPWYFESFNWDAPVWEQLSHQVIVPGYLIGLCVAERAGEVPNTERYRFRNVSYLANPQDLHQRGVDYIVYQKPNRLNIKKPYAKINHCDHFLQRIYGSPVYEDQIVKVYDPSVKVSG